MFGLTRMHCVPNCRSTATGQCSLTFAGATTTQTYHSRGHTSASVDRRTSVGWPVEAGQSRTDVPRCCVVFAVTVARTYHSIDARAFPDDIFVFSGSLRCLRSNCALRKARLPRTTSADHSEHSQVKNFGKQWLVPPRCRQLKNGSDWFDPACLPPVTRAYLILSVITTVLCSLEVVRELHLYFNFRQILQGQVWRLVTCFLYFAPFSFDFVFQMYLLVRYCRSLEEGSFRGRSSGFLWMLLLGAAMMIAVAPFIKSRASMFLGPSLTFMVVYVWARRNPYVRLSLFGLFDFTAPYLPWVLLGFSMILGASPVKDLLGIAVGHVYYFFEDVYPRMSHGYRLLATPGILAALFGETQAAPRVQRPPPMPAAFGQPAPAQAPAPEAQPEQEPQGHLHED